MVFAKFLQSGRGEREQLPQLYESSCPLPIAPTSHSNSDIIAQTRTAVIMRVLLLLNSYTYGYAYTDSQRNADQYGTSAAVLLTIITQIGHAK